MSRKKRTIRRPIAKRKKQKKTKRLWGLEVRTFNRGIRQFMDQDYVSQLSDAEKEWLSEFNETYYSNKFPAKDKKGRKTNRFDKAGIPRKEIYDQTNARNRDVHAVFYKINADGGRVQEDNSKQALSIFDKEREGIEDELVEYIDYRRFVQQFLDAGFSKSQARREAERMISEMQK